MDRFEVNRRTLFTVIVSRLEAEWRFEIDQPDARIGRGFDNDVVLYSDDVSEEHTRLVLKDGKFILIDLGSATGTYVNGLPVRLPIVLKQRDRIRVGCFSVSVECDGIDP